MESAYVRSTQEVLGHFQVTEDRGLSDDEVKQQLEKYGKNGTRSHTLCADTPA